MSKSRKKASLNTQNNGTEDYPKGGSLRPETKHSVCTKCGKEWHFDTAKYCGMCGEKLKEAPEKSFQR